MERIDKVYMNYACAENLSITNSDHSPLLLSFKIERGNVNKIFIFQKLWDAHNYYICVIKENKTPSNGGNDLYTLVGNLMNMRKIARIWNKAIFGNIFQKMNDAEDEVLKLEKILDLYNLVGDIKNMRKFQWIWNKATLI